MLKINNQRFFRIINLVDNISQINFGIWSAAIITAKALNDAYGVKSELWFPSVSAPEKLPEVSGATLVPLKNLGVNSVRQLIEERGLSTEDTIICTHGSWQYATKWGYTFSKLGYKWVYVPQGMLEPWSMEQKWWLKYPYFYLREQQYAKRAAFVRAVSSVEAHNLGKMFNQVRLIPNCVIPHTGQGLALPKPEAPITMAFMARLHYKKGIVPLVQAWVRSQLNNNPNWVLKIAGPDEGELTKIKAELGNSQTTNIELLGPVYGQTKTELLQAATYYALPTASEGFPTSLVEAMLWGCIPLLTTGANFPEAVNAHAGIKITQDIDQLVQSLNSLTNIDPQEKIALSQNARSLILNGYTDQIIAEQQYQAFSQVLGQ